ncbi:MAG: RNA-binding cell elongation regulator Jag/EloR [Syntrophales bacterium]|jgi:spoIIIJ-associated protein|nr:RNA-binding cell elongation regulator Jag/EloR [Syntrophales bacterium]
MKTLEIEAKTIDAAIDQACREFGVPREKLNIEILSEDSSGFLGILGARKAKIRASLLSIDVTLDTGSESRADIVVNIARPEAVPAVEPVTDSGAPPVHSAGDNQVGPRAKQFLEGLLARMGISCPVELEETADSIVLNIRGDGGGLLIGRRGQNLDAIQFLVNKAVNRDPESRKIVTVDTESYRKRREESLVALAKKVGDKVKKTRKAVSLSHMNAHDRRIIHLALQEDTELVTKSKGESDFRKIVIMPARRG